MKKAYMLKFLVATGFCSAPVAAQLVVVEAPSGTSYTMDVDASRSFNEVMGDIAQELSSIETESVNGNIRNQDMGWFKLNVSSMVKNFYHAPLARDYNAPLTPKEKEDLSYILRTLANESLLKINNSKGALKSSGDRIDNLHPFKFLEAIFTDDELIVCARNIKARTISLPWKGFLDGIVTSLDRENGIGNVMPYANEFAQQVGVPANHIIPLLEKRSWEKMVDVLIKEVQRKGNSGRHDM